MKRILTICIPTYKNKYVLEKEVREYLSLADARLCVKINDNASPDGTGEMVLGLQNQFQDNLQYRCNAENLGIIPNWILALSNAESEYVLFTLDKDLANVEELPSFMDYLEQESPCFGYVDLDINSPRGYEVTQPGLENVTKMAYLSKHPSGYFYRTDILNAALERESFRKLDAKFDFPFEVINGELAVMYPSTIVHQPVVINANIRKDVSHLPHPKKTLSYDESNLWYGAPMRTKAFDYYLDNAMNLNLSISDKCYLTNRILARAVEHVTTGLRYVMQQKAACDHYNVRMRKVGLFEMEYNMMIVLHHFHKRCSGVLPTSFILKQNVKHLIKTTKRIIKVVIKELFAKQQQMKLSA